MARPIKQGLDYFSFDVDFFSDEKISAIRGEFGIKGEIVVIKLLCAIYRNGYFALWSDVFKYGLLNQLPSISEGLLCNIVKRLVEWGFFEKSLFDSANILTSKGIQRRYFEVYRNRLRRRQQGGNDLQYWLLSEEKEDNESYDIVLTRQNPVKTQFCRVKTPQSKVKESKVNINPSADALIDTNTPRARNINAAAATERKVNIPPYESYSGEADTYSPEVRALCDEIAAKFNTFALPVHLSLLQKLILALHRPGVDAIKMVRDGLKKYDSAMAIQSKKVKFEITTFLKPEMFLRLYNGDYDTVYADAPYQRSFAPLPTSKRPIGEPSADDLPF